jgi:ribosomal protein S12 methylthiotransferase accessory factor
VDLEIRFPGGLQVDASFNGFVVHTDQPAASGGEGSAPSPFDLFLASLATCAGIYVLRFLRQRDVPSDGVRLAQRVVSNPATGMVEEIMIEIQIPQGFPEKYVAPMIRAAELCAVKKHLERPPATSVLVSRPPRTRAELG